MARGRNRKQQSCFLCGLANLGIILLKNRAYDLFCRASMIFSRKEIYEK